jgi:hypothetical protein
LIDPAPRRHWAAPGRVTNVARFLREIMAEEVHRPARLHRTEVAGTLGSQGLKRCGDLLAFGGWPSGGRRVLKPWESSRLVGFEPGAHGMCIAVEPLSDLGDTPARGIPYDIVTACSDLGPSTACLFHLRLFFWRQDKADHQGFSQAGHPKRLTDCVGEEHFF